MYSYAKYTEQLSVRFNLLVNFFVSRFLRSYIILNGGWNVPSSIAMLLKKVRCSNWCIRSNTASQTTTLSLSSTNASIFFLLTTQLNLMFWSISKASTIKSQVLTNTNNRMGGENKRGIKCATITVFTGVKNSKMMKNDEDQE